MLCDAITSNRCLHVFLLILQAKLRVFVSDSSIVDESWMRLFFLQVFLFKQSFVEWKMKSENNSE